MAQGDIKITKINNEYVVEIREAENPLEKLTKTEYEIYKIIDDITQDCYDLHIEKMIACAKAIAEYTKGKKE